MSVQQRTHVAVLGAGLTGVATALELAIQGIDVVLVDQDELAVNRASLRNEGKIHLGLLYANDRTLATASLQLRGALHFRSLISRWAGPQADSLRRSTPFVYLVAKDSLLSAEQLETHYASVESLYRQYLSQDRDSDYLGDRPDHLFERCPLERLEPFLRTEYFAAAFQTSELAIDTDHLATLLRGAVSGCRRIRFLGGHRVASVTRGNGCMLVEGTGPDGTWRLETEQVVNALWENRLAIDRTIGLETQSGWVHRLKYRVIARIPERLRSAPSTTMVLGRYGDVVIRQDGTAYLSWYPLGLRGWTHELAPPLSWNGPCRGELSKEESESIAGGILNAIDSWYPGVAQSTPLVVDAGAIVAYGQTDVHDASSGLHDRSRIGVVSANGYHSIEPGKLTTAPLFAKLAAERVLARADAT